MEGKEVDGREERCKELGEEREARGEAPPLEVLWVLGLPGLWSIVRLENRRYGGKSREGGK